MVGLIRKDWASGLDKLKKPFTVYIALPLVGLSTSIVFFMSIAAVVIIVVMLSHQYRSKLKTQPSNTTSNNKKIDLQSDQYQQQRQAIIKLTSGIVILATGILLEAIGAILHALDKTKNRVFFFILLHTVIAFLLFEFQLKALQLPSTTLIYNKIMLVSQWSYTYEDSLIISVSFGSLSISVSSFPYGLSDILVDRCTGNPTIASDLEKLRKTFTTAIAIPLVGISTAIVFFLSIGTVVIIVYMLRQKAKLVPDNSEQYQLQKQTMVKLTIGVSFLQQEF
ncbi:hypothetical protein C9374_002735 [Naegleria lovaniensis]|uniref:Transmembrane protein n=1 Tax=Naegleria lovaniensis TaxID=51637 RepID=A0AA88KLX5_NAELO|nr:uncharacterized protein C9374_002735 [Naegleria lovaniensis]KAG2386289.1 hypothetical protein C9374_002735 [Naegleria lovaniensis]